MQVVESIDNLGILGICFIFSMGVANYHTKMDGNVESMYVCSIVYFRLSNPGGYFGGTPYVCFHIAMYARNERNWSLAYVYNIHGLLFILNPKCYLYLKSKNILELLGAFDWLFVIGTLLKNCYSWRRNGRDICNFVHKLVGLLFVLELSKSF